MSIKSSMTEFSWSPQREFGTYKKTKLILNTTCTKLIFPQLKDESWRTDLTLLIDILHFTVYRLFNDASCSLAWKDQ